MGAFNKNTNVKVSSPKPLVMLIVQVTDQMVLQIHYKYMLAPQDFD